MLIIPYSALNKSMISIRPIDKTIVYRSDYIGPAKIKKIVKMQFIKHPSKTIIKIAIIDTISDIAVCGILIHILSDLMILYPLLYPSNFRT
jgi:hypothetical protein